MEIKQAIKQVFKELFDKGEILKAQYFINSCVPLDIKNDPQILDMVIDTNAHINEIKRWGTEGRPYPGTHVTVDFQLMPKFVKAKDIIVNRNIGGSLLDVGCYSGVFMQEMSKFKMFCCGIDVHRELMEFLDDDNLDKRLEYRFGSSESIPYKDSRFDAVTCFDTLEHVLNFEKSISEIERVCKNGGLIIINLPRMTLGYKDDSHEHLRMLDDEDINKVWGNKKDFNFEFCQDELGRPTSFITYINEK